MAQAQAPYLLGSYVKLPPASASPGAGSLAGWRDTWGFVVLKQYEWEARFWRFWKTLCINRPSESSCLSLLNAKITSLCHHNTVYIVSGQPKVSLSGLWPKSLQVYIHMKEKWRNSKKYTGAIPSTDGGSEAVLPHFSEMQLRPSPGHCQCCVVAECLIGTYHVSSALSYS